MRAVQFTSYGRPDVLHVVDVDPPHPGPGEIVIDVASAGINQLDAKIRSGAMASVRPATFPLGTGFDAAGTVRAAGPGVDDVSAGDVVFGIGRDTLAEQAVLGEWAKLPARVNPSEAGGWGVAVETAGRLLNELGIDTGTVLVSGASGGVGSALVQLAHGRGLRVVGTAGEKNQAYLAGLGAVPVVYGPDLVQRVTAAAPDGIDGALDISGAGVIGDLVAIVGDPGQVISISDFTAPTLGARVSTGANRSSGPHVAFAEALALPRFHLHIERSFTLEEAPAAHEHAEAGHTVGKLVVIP